MGTNLMLVVMLACARVEGNPSGRPTDFGRTHGVYCASRAVVTDVNKKYKTHFTWENLRYSRMDSEKVFVLYARMWHSTTPEQIARRWNGGPKGMNKPGTRVYWQKVARELLSPTLRERYYEALAIECM